MLRWPDRAAVASSVAAWARAEGPRHAELLRVGMFGSYARGDWGPGSDVDLVALVASSSLPFERRATAWDLLPLPVPADLLVYTAAEWDALVGRGERFARTLLREVVWVWP